MERETIKQKRKRRNIGINIELSSIFFLSDFSSLNFRR
jgi:hypothetical protein